VVGQHIILLPKEKQLIKSKEEKIIKLSGNVIDAETKQKIENVSVYNIGDRSSAITDSKGLYALELPENGQLTAINFSKKNYRDTTIFHEALEHLELDLALVPDRKQTDPLDPLTADLLTPAPISELKLVKLFVPEEAMINAENIKVYEKRAAQISFLPYLGSNAKVSGTVTNNISLNVLAGFTGAVNGVEIGSILNISKRHVNGVQIAGFGNITGDYSRGAQVAGFFNKTTGTIQGLQLAGFTNLVRDTVSGLQVAGFLNTAKGSVSGLQLVGFSNIVKDKLNGVQIAGFNNVQLGELNGVQISGFNNYSNKTMDGLQLTGFLNIARGNVKIGQVAGFANYSDGVHKGVQVAGFINMADSLSGFQLGVVNISDNSKGISIGLVNHVKQGYRSFELSANEVLPLNLSYRSGTHKFYNVYSVGFNPAGKSSAGAYRWSVGFGFGSILYQNAKWAFDLELSANQINEYKIWENELNLYNKMALSFNYKIGKRFSLVAGPAYNVHVSSLKDADTGQFNSRVAFFPFYETSSSSTRVQMWFGGKVGIIYNIAGAS